MTMAPAITLYPISYAANVYVVIYIYFYVELHWYN